MILPSMAYADGIRKQKQIQFGGLNHTVGAEDGELWDMRNLCSDDYPVLSVRPRRLHLRTLEKPNGLFYWKGLMWVDGTDVYHEGVLVGQVSDSRKTFGAVGDYIVILPDKVCYHVGTGEFEALEMSWEQAGEYVLKSDSSPIFSASGDNSICARAEAVKVSPTLEPDDVVSVVDFSECFREGDAVTIFGVKDADGNVLEDGYTAIIRGFAYSSGRTGSADAESYTYYAFSKIIFYEGTLANVTLVENAAIVIQRKVPEFVQVCEDGNRLWGCDGDTIYASKLGDPFNWNVFDGVDTDSWAVTPGSSGEFTGCCNFQGYPTFFKEDRMYKVYGSLPSDFQVVDSPCLGVAKGCGGTLAVVGDSLFYLGANGPMVCTGSLPYPVGRALGTVRLVGGMAGSDGLKYYACLESVEGLKALYVYDAQRRLWHIEDEMEAVGFGCSGGDLCCLDAQGRLMVLGSPKEVPEGAAPEAAIQWSAEFGDFTEENPNHKGLSKLQLRLQMEEGSETRVLVQYDSDGTWRLVRALSGESGKRNYYLPIIPRRCDHYRIRLEGTGRCRLYSMVRETYGGSERNARGN